MNENLDLTKILKDVPAGTVLYSPMIGTVEFVWITESTKVYPIKVKAKGREWSFTKEGYYLEDNPGTECMLFPSKEQRDWSKFYQPKPKRKVTLHPFDRVLVRDSDVGIWAPEHFGRYRPEHPQYKYIVIAGSCAQCIPYTRETAELLGTSDPCPIEFELEFSKEYVEQ